MSAMPHPGTPTQAAVGLIGVQSPLPLSWQVNPGVSATPSAPRHLRLVGSGGDGDSTYLPAPTAEWVARMARAVSEVGLGLRPPGQLTRWVRRDTLAWLGGRGIAYQRHPSTRAANARQGSVRPMTQVRAVRICRVSAAAVECSAVLVGGGRARAIALRFEQDATAWIITALTLG